VVEKLKNGVTRVAPAPPPVKVRDSWDEPDLLQTTLDRETARLEEAKKQLARSQSSPNPSLQKQIKEEVEVRQRGVKILSDRIASIQGKTEAATEALSGMKKAGMGQQGSTAIPQAIVELGSAIYQKGTQFAKWAASMVKKLGEGVRPFLKDVWGKITSAVNSLEPAARRTATGSMQRAVVAPEGGAFGGRGGAGFQQAQKERRTFSGLEGKERYEIDDSKMEVVVAPDVGQSIPLGEAINHPDLFASYPEAKTIKVKAVSGPPGAKFNPFKNEITLSEYGGANLSNSRYYTRALLHEIQHWIQHKEGFATEGSRS